MITIRKLMTVKLSKSSAVGIGEYHSRWLATNVIWPTLKGAQRDAPRLVSINIIPIWMSLRSAESICYEQLYYIEKYTLISLAIEELIPDASTIIRSYINKHGKKCVCQAYLVNGIGIRNYIGKSNHAMMCQALVDLTTSFPVHGILITTWFNHDSYW